MLGLQIAQRGFQVISTWLTEIPDSSSHQEYRRARRAVKNIEEITKADLVIVSMPLTNCLVEFGVALALGKDILMSCSKNDLEMDWSVFLHGPNVEKATSSIKVLEYLDRCVDARGAR